MKIAVNRCFGGFGLSHKAMMRYAELAGITLYPSINVRDHEGRLTDIYAPYREGDKKPLFLYYFTKPINDDGTFDNDAFFTDRDIKRDDPALIKVVEEMGKKASGDYGDVQIVEIPDGVDWVIEEYDGSETVEEAHRSW